MRCVSIAILHSRHHNYYQCCLTGDRYERMEREGTLHSYSFLLFLIYKEHIQFLFIHFYLGNNRRKIFSIYIGKEQNGK